MSLPKTNTNCHVIEDVNDGKPKHTKNQLIIDQYKLLKTLQKGEFGEVKLGKHLITGEKVAIKVINKVQQKQRTFDEILRDGRAADPMGVTDHFHAIEEIVASVRQHGSWKAHCRVAHKQILRIRCGPSLRVLVRNTNCSASWHRR